jgi:hypothetical protein
MREYKIKRGHNPDLNALVSRYFGTQGNITQGMQFSVNGIGDVTIKQEKSSLFIDIVPPKTICGDYNVIKRWNEFLFEAT